ncbi:MAG: hypothetical protein J7J93_02015 [Candidatus Aenigmarchaeota archaeon]|nr:hypothetical protein [Candidatus Aenigmarchaeota archaeon]
MREKFTIALVLLYVFSTPLVTAKIIYIDQFGEDINDQYSYNYDYSQAVVKFIYNEINTEKLIGTIQATNLKPYTTYQVKISGKPTCKYSEGNDLINEYIGLIGRWTCLDCSGSALQRNRNDAQYYARSHFRGDGSECIQGYLVFDFFTVDDNGNAEKTIESKNSYHVLWCGGGTCNSKNNNHLNKPDPNHPDTYFCPIDKVDGEIERGTCDGLRLSDGKYNVIISLTEESFHQGHWAVVLKKDIEFEIGQTTTTTTIQTTTTTTRPSWSPPTWEPPKWEPPRWTPPTWTIPQWNPPTWNFPTTTTIPITTTIPNFRPPTWTIPSWNPTSWTIPTWNIPKW